MATDTQPAAAPGLQPTADHRPPPVSPCVSICELDAAAQVCIGCGRLLTEIAEWSGASDGRRWQIRDAAAQRRAAIESAALSSSNRY